MHRIKLNLNYSPSDITLIIDGKYLAYAAYSKQTKKWFVVVNEQEGKSYNYLCFLRLESYPHDIRKFFCNSSANGLDDN